MVACVMSMSDRRLSMDYGVDPVAGEGADCSGIHHDLSLVMSILFPGSVQRQSDNFSPPIVYFRIKPLLLSEQ